MASFEITAVPVNTCYLVKCDSCGKTSWKVRTLVSVSIGVTAAAAVSGDNEMWGLGERQPRLAAGPCNVPDSNFAGGAAITGAGRAHNAGSHVSISPRSPSSRQGARAQASGAGRPSPARSQPSTVCEADDYVSVRSQGCGQHADAVMQSVKEEDKCTCPR
ncbi:hypothetical protein VTO73DRAFT_8422 [Trametes versicolor]